MYYRILSVQLAGCWPIRNQKKVFILLLLQDAIIFELDNILNESSRNLPVLLACFVSVRLYYHRIPVASSTTDDAQMMKLKMQFLIYRDHLLKRLIPSRICLKRYMTTDFEMCSSLLGILSQPDSDAS